MHTIVLVSKRAGARASFGLVRTMLDDESQSLLLPDPARTPAPIIALERRMQRAVFDAGIAYSLEKACIKFRNMPETVTPADGSSDAMNGCSQRK